MLSNIEFQDRIHEKIEMISFLEEKVNAFVENGYSEEYITTQRDSLIANKGDLPLRGYLLGVKDLFITDGFETKCGSLLPPSLFEGKEASSVTAMKKVGCIVAGKTVTTEFATWHPGKTRNPNNYNHTPGGSSSGSAAAVAAGFVDIAFGTQTNGSIIRPASYCDVIGLKPSYNRVNTDGIIPFSPSGDHFGIFVNDLDLLDKSMKQLVADWTEIPKINKEQIVLGIPIGKYLDQADKDGLENFWANIELLRKEGITIKEIPFLDDVDFITSEYEKLIYSELAGVHEKWFNEYKDLYRPKTVECIIAGKKITLSEQKQLKLDQLAFIESIEQKMNNEQIYAWIVPSAKGIAPKGIDSTGTPAMNGVWTYSRLPAISIPIGRDELTNLPYGIQIIGESKSDEKLLAITKTINNIL